MLPQYQDSTLHFERINVQMGVEHGTQARVGGDAFWRGGSELGANLHGELTLPAQGSAAVASTPAPALSAAAVPATPRNYTFSLQVQPAQAANPMTAALKLDGEGKHVNVNVQPAALPGWWNDVLGSAPETALAMPPISGNARLDAVDFGPLHMQGVQIEAGAQVMPLGGSSTAAPATATSGR